MKVRKVAKEHKVGIRSSLRLRERDRTIGKKAEVINSRVIKSTIISKTRKMVNEEKPSTSREAELTELLKMMMKKNDTSVSAECFEKIIPKYDGKVVPVKQWFDNFEKNADAYELTEKQKYVHARNKMTDVAKLFLESVTVADYETLKKELYAEFHCELDSAEIHAKLTRRKMKENESFREYVLQLKKIATLGNIEESAIIKYAVEGIDVDKDAKYLLYTSNSLKDLYEKFDIVQKVDKRNGDAKKKVNRMENSKTAVHCFNCGSTQHKRNECKAETKCFKCNENGHIARNCNKINSTVRIITNQGRLKRVIINEMTVDCLVDTGADVSIIKNSIFLKLKNLRLQDSMAVLRGLGNGKAHAMGYFVGDVEVDGLKISQKLLVLEDDKMEFDGLLGFDFISKFECTLNTNGYRFKPLQTTAADYNNKEFKELSILNIFEKSDDINVPPQYKHRINDIIENYQPATSVFECPVELKIVPDEKCIPFRQAPSRLPVNEAEAVKIQVDKWLKQGIVRKSTSNYASRVVVVKKKDGTYRVCIDFRQLNAMVLRDCFPVPLMDDVIEKLQQSFFFTVMDLENGYLHVPIEEASKKYTAFVTKEGLFEFNRTPFGFCNSPAVFMRFVCFVFQDLINENIMELYMDDIIVYAQTEEECLQKTEKVLETAAKFMLKIKWEKCHFLQRKINFLGHIIESGSVRPGEEKTNAVRNFPTPKSVTDVQAFLGLTGFFRRFVADYAAIARPLTNLLKKDARFHMGAAEINAVQQLKKILTSEPVLKIFCRNAPTELHTDASKHGFGATLIQIFDDQPHPVFYWSKKASEAESAKHSFVLEVKAAYLALRKFRHYVLGIRFKLITDCAAFKQTTSKKDVPREVTQWVLYMQDFNFSIEHRAGNRIKHVDSLSRHPQEVMVISSEIGARLRKAQEGDKFIKVVAEILKKQPYEHFKYKGGLIFKSIAGNDLLVVPKSMELEIIKNAHEEGHFGLQKTIHSVQQTYWIPHVEKKVNNLVSNCIKCIIFNKKLGKREGRLNIIEKGDIPLHTLHIDHLGPMDATSKQYKYIFAMVDGFAKFVWLYPTKTTAADEVLKKFEDWAIIFGTPTRIVSDRGPAFLSNAFQEYVKENGIEHVLTTTGVPRGNGQIERVNRTILAVISKLSSTESTKWYKFVPKVQKAINSSVHNSTKRSPFELMFGVKMKNNADSMILQILDDELIENFDCERQRAREEARKQIQHAQQLYKQNYDKNRKDERSYNIGDMVAIKRTQLDEN